MRLLLVNWQDRENPQAGGAEIHLHEIFGRLAARGHDITLLCGGWPGCPRETRLDGMRVVRAGTRATFPLHAWRTYRALAHEKPFDAIVEDINKVPLFTPLWGRTPVVAVIPHLFGATVFQEAPVAAAAVVWLAERPLPWIYRRVPFHVISQSTAQDLADRGVSPDRIDVIYCGIDSAHYTPDTSQRAPQPLFAYLGRLKKYKRVDLVIDGFAAAQLPNATLEIAGSGDYRAELEARAAALGVADRVKFLGRIDEREKQRLLQRAWALVFTSPKEGWGITNLEAAASGTPVVASNSPGIRESVRDGETGFLVPHADIPALAAALRTVAGDRALVERLGVAGRVFATSFTWERAAEQTEAHLQRVLTRTRS